MPQGDMKVKSKLPGTMRGKKKEKGPPISKRNNAPVTQRRAKNVQVQKLKKLITKTVNATAEEQLRAIAMDGKKTLLNRKNTSGGKIKKNKKN